jgi:hypothetical protein
MYDSTTLKPVMPYDPNAFISARTADALKDGRPEEIRRICALWFSSACTPDEIETKCEELVWVSTLLFAGTGKPGRKPRLDFFLMHILNSTLFLPSLLDLIPNPESKTKLLKAYLPTVMLTLLIRGRPRIDPELVMTYSVTPLPPPTYSKIELDPKTIGDPSDPETVNPWPAILSSVLHAPDAHTLKAIRVLCAAARKYGRTPAGQVVGAFGRDGKETHRGISKVDGSVFVRAAGVTMGTLGWVDHGQKAGQWDRSVLGWEDAWKDGR